MSADSLSSLSSYIREIGSSPTPLFMSAIENAGLTTSDSNPTSTDPGPSKKRNWSGFPILSSHDVNHLQKKQKSVPAAVVIQQPPAAIITPQNYPPAQAPTAQTQPSGFPICIGSNLILFRLGQIVGREFFHDENNIWPVGYLSYRFFESTRSPTKFTFYRCEIMDGTYQPLFRITPEDDPKNSYTSTNLEDCWTILSSKLLRYKTILQLRPPISGADFFGLSLPYVTQQIQSSPSAALCRSYKFKTFAAVSPSLDAVPADHSPDIGAFLKYFEESFQHNERFAMAAPLFKSLFTRRPVALAPILFPILCKVAALLYSPNFDKRALFYIFDEALKANMFTTSQDNVIKTWREHAIAKAVAATRQPEQPLPPPTYPVHVPQQVSPAVQRNVYRPMQQPAPVQITPVKNMAIPMKKPQPVCERIGFMFNPTVIKLADSIISFKVADQLMDIVEKFKPNTNACPLQVQLQCSPNVIVPLSNVRISIAVNEQLLPMSFLEPMSINPYCIRGKNLIRIYCQDLSPQYILKLQLMRYFTPEELLQRVQKSPVTPTFDQSKQKVRDSFSSDSEIVQLSVRVSTRCPLTKTRINYPGRSTLCKHIQCFDVLNFIEFSLRYSSQKRKWHCPVCDLYLHLDELYFDPFFAVILSAVSPSVGEIDINPDGSYQIPKSEEKVNEIVDLTGDDDVYPPLFIKSEVPQLSEDDLLHNYLLSAEKNELVIPSDHDEFVQTCTGQNFALLGDDATSEECISAGSVAELPVSTSNSFETPTTAEASKEPAEEVMIDMNAGDDLQISADSHQNSSQQPQPVLSQGDGDERSSDHHNNSERLVEYLPQQYSDIPFIDLNVDPDEEEDHHEMFNMNASYDEIQIPLVS